MIAKVKGWDRRYRMWAQDGSRDRAREGSWDECVGCGHGAAQQPSKRGGIHGNMSAKLQCTHCGKERHSLD